MSDLDTRLRETLDRVADSTRVHRRVHEIVQDRPRRSMPSFTVGLAAFAAVAALFAIPIFIAASVSNPSDTQADGALITSEQILEDGVVTEDEYRAGVAAVVSCLKDAGFDARATFDEPNSDTSLSGHAELWVGHGSEARETATEAMNRCHELHLSHNVSLGWSVALGELDLEALGEEFAATLECVETLTGQDFGKLTFDEHGYLTKQGQQTKDAAFEYQDHQPWGTCRNDLGFQEDHKADTRAGPRMRRRADR